MLFFTQLSYHLMRKLMKNSSMASNTYLYVVCKFNFFQWVSFKGPLLGTLWHNKMRIKVCPLRALKEKSNFYTLFKFQICDSQRDRTHSSNTFKCDISINVISFVEFQGWWVLERIFFCQKSTYSNEIVPLCELNKWQLVKNWA